MLSCPAIAWMREREGERREGRRERGRGEGGEKRCRGEREREGEREGELKREERQHPHPNRPDHRVRVCSYCDIHVLTSSRPHIENSITHTAP